MIRELCIISVLLNLLRFVMTQDVVFISRYSLCTWVKCSKNVDQIQLVDGIVQFFYNLADFLATSSVGY